MKQIFQLVSIVDQVAAAGDRNLVERQREPRTRAIAL
jgi:hypothetical protein